MRQLSMIAAFIFSALFSFSQTTGGKATVTITNEQKTALEGATVELLHSKDSTLVKAALTDNLGVAEFEHLKSGSYLLRASAVGHSMQYSPVFSVADGEAVMALPSLVLSAKASTQMAGVTVTAKKPFIQKLNDRLVVNVESSIVGAGSSALDVLEQSPGITIDQNDAVSLRGKAGVSIMIDGKPSPMSATDLANYLRGLPASAIESIHIITNPSAKYDAAGNSGIIDIHLKKDQRLGANGTLTGGYGQGYYPKANAGGTFNYRNKKVNVFGNYNYSYRKMMNHLYINRNFYDNGVFTGSDDKANRGVIPFSSHNARMGADFFPSKNTIVGFVVNSNFNGITRTADVRTTKNDVQGKPESRFETYATNNDQYNNVVGNVNLKHTFDTTGKELSADIDYGVFNSSSLTRTATSYYDLLGNPKQPGDILDGDQSGALKLRTAKADYVNPLKKGAKFELGFKTSYVSSDNDAKFYNVDGSDSQVDTMKTNRFYYKEYNNAGYVNYSREIKKFNVQLGLRGEQTRVNTRQVKGNLRYKDSYFELFPSAFLNYKLSDKKTVGLSVSRRIDRPGYGELNPFLFQIDATVYATGSPNLRPQMTMSYEGSYTVKNLSFTLGYSHTKDPQNIVISRILDVIPTFEIKPGSDSNITVQIPVNLESSDYVGLTATTPIRISKWWNMVNNANFFYNHFNGNLGGAVLNNGAPALNLRTNNTFTFKKGWSAELNANWNSGGQYGYMRSRPDWGMAVGGQKTVLSGKGTVRLNVSDIFWTSYPRATITYEGRYVEHWHAKRDSRVANLSFTYRFGNNKVQAARKRTTGSEEEARRAGN